MDLLPLLVPAGNDTEVQFNDGGLFAGDSSLTWDDGAAKALTIAGASVVGLDSAVFQPATDSTTFLQVLDADGGTPVLNVDTTNERVGFMTASPETNLHVYNNAASEPAGYAQIKVESENWHAYVIVDANDGKDAWIEFQNSGTRMWTFGGRGAVSDQYQIRDDDNTVRLAIQQDGKVGIGTTSPDELLDIGNGGKLTIHSAGNDKSVDIYHDDTDAIIGPSSGELHFGLGIDSKTRVIRTTTQTAAGRSGLYLEHESTGDMADGFGTGLNFVIKDSGSTNEIATIWGVRNGADDQADLTFRLANGGSPTEKMRLTSGGNVGIGTTSPSKALEIDRAGEGAGNTQLRLSTGAANYWDIGRDQNTGDFVFIDDGLGTVMTLDQATGNVGIGTVSPSLPLSALEKTGLTPIGGFAIKLTNNTGVNSVKGQLVEADDTDENSYKTAAADSVEVIGVVYIAGVTDGSEAWIVVMGIAEVLVDGGGCVHGDRLISSNTAGSADVSNAPAVAVHFQEIGHAIETVVGAGLAKTVLHFN